MIDTAAKRRMAASFKPILKAPIPDGTIDVNDRVHIGWNYGGIFVVIDLEDVLRQVKVGYSLGRVKPGLYNLGRSLVQYTLRGGTEMQIELTPAQWDHLKDIVIHGERTARALGIPVEVSNSATSIDIEDDKTVINIPDE